jgi:hypothetical protein
LTHLPRGTIFEDTKLPLRTWFIAIWMLTSHEKGIAGTQLARDLGSAASARGAGPAKRQ